jgi:uncharacterized protein YoxC
MIALIVLVIFAIQVLRKLLVTLDHTNKVLEDVEVVSEIAANRSEDIDQIIEDVSGTVSNIAESRDASSFVTTAYSVAKSAASLKGMIDGDDLETRAAKRQEKKQEKRERKSRRS